MVVTASELRVGNLVLAGIMTTPTSVLTIDYDIRDGFIVNRSIPVADLHGIPLSPEVLKAAGFSYCKKPDWYVNQPELENIEYRVKKVAGGWRISKGFFKWDDELTLIHHLHELQNVYFAIQHGELTYNPSK